MLPSHALMHLTVSHHDNIMDSAVGYRLIAAVAIPNLVTTGHWASVAGAFNPRLAAG